MQKYLYLIITILIICLFFTCKNDYFNCNPATVTTDTLTTHTSDTIYQKDTIWNFKYKTITRPVNVYINTQKDTIRVYNDTLSDTNLVIMLKDTINGILLGQNISYKLKVPVKIIDSVFVNITKTELAKKRTKFLVGLGTSEGIQNFNIAPLVGLQAPNGRIALYEYNISQKEHNIKLLLPINLKRTNK